MGKNCHQLPNGTESLLVQVLERNNLIRALQQVKRNQGAAGVDGMTVDGLPTCLKHHWPEIKGELLNGDY